MPYIEWDDLLYPVFFMIVKHLYIKVFDQVKVNLVPIIPDVHDEHTILIQQLNLLVE